MNKYTPLTDVDLLKIVSACPDKSAAFMTLYYAYVELRRAYESEANSNNADDHKTDIPTHQHYVWRHGITSSGRRYKQCGCGQVNVTQASVDELEIAKRERRDIEDKKETDR
jgi:hypothetical protein